jgi:hypothetical protein
LPCFGIPSIFLPIFSLVTSEILSFVHLHKLTGSTWIRGATIVSSERPSTRSTYSAIRLATKRRKPISPSTCTQTICIHFICTMEKHRATKQSSTTPKVMYEEAARPREPFLYAQQTRRAQQKGLLVTRSPRARRLCASTVCVIL